MSQNGDEDSINCVVCKLPDSGFMIACDRCDFWYHGRCVGETKKSSQKKAKWYCTWCKEWRKHFQSLGESHRALMCKVDELQTEVDKLKSRNATFKEPGATKERDLSSLEKCDKVQIPCENCKTHQEMAAKFQHNLTLKEVEVNNLKVELNTIKEELELLKNQYESCKTLQESVAEYQRKLTAEQVKVDNLEAILNVQKNPCESCKTLQESVAEYQRKLAAEQVKVDNLEAILNVKRNPCESCKTLQESVDNLEAVLNLKNGEVENLKLTIISLRKRKKLSVSQS